jgi:hypothetical protein
VSLVLAGLDVLSQVRRPRLSVGQFDGLDATDLFGDAGIPQRVQVPLFAIESGVDLVATDLDGLHVQGLRDITQEVDEPAESIVDFEGRQNGRLLHALCVVCDGGHDAAFSGMAVTLIVHVTTVRWVVFRIDEVESVNRSHWVSQMCRHFLWCYHSHSPCREFACRRVTVCIGPCGDVGKVGRRCIAQDVLSPRFGVALDQASGYVGDSLMSESAPGVRPGAQKREQSQRSVHIGQAWKWDGSDKAESGQE